MSRGLIGMTQGARKRAARRDFLAAMDPSSSVEAQSGLLAKVRERYRIGERLRPCPGCPICQPDAAEILDDESWYLHNLNSPHPCEYSCGEVGVGDVCDGSGVLARRRT